MLCGCDGCSPTGDSLSYLGLPERIYAYLSLSSRNGFKKDHLRGALKFVEDNWQLVHKGAGWRALRNFLVVWLFSWRFYMRIANILRKQGLGLHGYLESNEVSQILARYEALTSMEPM